MRRFTRDQWALILGGSSGLGLATAKKLASEGMSVLVVHRDRKGAMARIEQEFEAIRAHGERAGGAGFAALNLDALAPEGVESVARALRELLGESGRVRLMLHSIAAGNLKPLVGEGLVLEDEDLSYTIHAMGTSLLTYVRRLHQAGLFAGDARVVGLTSEGSRMAWRGYAAISAAKSALESVARSIAVEYARHGIRCNVIQAGVTDTPALRMIPGNERLREIAQARNPCGRATRPEDVAGAVALLASDEAAWINGAVIPVDGGEHVAAAL